MEYGFVLCLSVDGFRPDQLVVQIELHLGLFGVDLHIDGFAFPACPVPALPSGPNAPHRFLDVSTISVGLFHSHIQTGSLVPEHLAIVTDGFAPTRDVNIAAIGAVPIGLSSGSETLAWTFSFVVITANARFAQVVEPCPHHIANNIRVVADCSPVAESVARIALRLPHHTFGIALMVCLVFENHVVVATNIEHIEVRVVNLPVTVPSTERFRHRSRLVTLKNGSFQLLGSLNHAEFLAFDDLVAYAPRDDARVIPVAHHHRMNVLAIAGVNHRRIVVLQLRSTPSVESLAYDEHAQGVASVEESPCSGVVTGSDEVEASLLHQPDFTYFRSVESHRSQYAVVVMHAGSVEEQRLPVEHKSLFSIERERANTVFCLLTVNDGE